MVHFFEENLKKIFLNNFSESRLYFTSESHIHSLLTILSEGGLVDVSFDHEDQVVTCFSS